MSKDFIPPIIEDMINKLSDPTVNVYNKDNYAVTLTKIEKAINQALLRHNGNKKPEFPPGRMIDLSGKVSKGKSL